MYPTVLLHDAQELDDNLGARPDQDLPLSSLLGIVDGVQAIVKDGCFDHFVGIVGLSRKVVGLRIYREFPES